MSAPAATPPISSCPPLHPPPSIILLYNSTSGPLPHYHTTTTTHRHQLTNSPTYPPPYTPFYHRICASCRNLLSQQTVIECRQTPRCALVLPHPLSSFLRYPRPSLARLPLLLLALLVRVCGFGARPAAMISRISPPPSASPSPSCKRPPSQLHPTPKRPRLALSPAHLPPPGPTMPDLPPPSLPLCQFVPAEKPPPSSRSTPTPSLTSTICSSCTYNNAAPPPPPSSASLAAQLPDEVLVSIFRFIPSASNLASLRAVCRHWCYVIDHTPQVWRTVSFKHARFSKPVLRFGTRLFLGPRSGRRAITMAARSGNEWARFVKTTLFDCNTLRAVTTPQPMASQLVTGHSAMHVRPYPPWLGHRPPCHDGVWVAIHASRRNPTIDPTPRCQASLPLPRGAMVGIVHVSHAICTKPEGERGANWVWNIDRAVPLKRPIRCAGFVGLWSISAFLTDLLVNAMQNQ